MVVHEAIKLAQEWVLQEGVLIPSFIGAHLLGSIDTLSAESAFPTCRDVDIKIILAKGKRGNQAISYRGLMLDVAFGNPEEYEATAVLTNPRLASHLAHGNILADPTGLLSDLHQLVAKEYGRHQWIKTRCQWEKKFIQDTLDQPNFTVLFLSFTHMYLGGLLAVADLKTPTHRRSLIIMKQILQRYNRSNLHEKSLEILGFASVTRFQAETYLAEIANAFPRAVAIYQTPIPYVGYKLRTHLFPYYIDASQEMIDEGHHQEALQWILHAYYLLNVVFQNDGTPTEKQAFTTKYQQLLMNLDLAEPAQLAEQREATRRLLPSFYALADEIVDGKLEEGAVE